MPHVPQWALLDWRSAQPMGGRVQYVPPEGQRHPPPMQCIPGLHGKSHAPQLQSSLDRSVHPEEQMVSPKRQAHVPSTHDRLGRHGLPHAPQFEMSVRVSTQDISQTVRGGAQMSSGTSLTSGASRTTTTSGASGTPRSSEASVAATSLASGTSPGALTIASLGPSLVSCESPVSAASPASGAAFGTHVAEPLCSTQLSLAVHCGLHDDTHAPATQV